MVTPAEQLDARFRRLKPLAGLARRPPRGWIKAIREALGLTTQQFARRLKVSQPRVIILEKSEVEGRLTLESLERAAQALGCEVVYALIPKRPLTKTLNDRASQLADELVGAVDQTMRLEAQQVKNAAFQRKARHQLKRQLLERPSRLWNKT